ncbi:MAG: hypothetical protein Q8O74_00865 [bacterium]|nr:hypothetical protein [bacterium]
MTDIPEKILLAAAKCPHELACLKGGEGQAHQRCPVKYPNGENVLFLAGAEHKVCPYRQAFASSHVCRCPVHYYLHGRD